MSIYTIKMDFRRAKQKADELDSVYHDLKKLAESQYDSTLNQLSHDWTGENSVHYIKKGGVLKEQILRSAGEIHHTAETIRAIARKIYEAEMEAWRIAHDRD